MTYDSTLLAKLLYSRLMRTTEDEVAKETKKRNIHQQLEEKPDELSDDSDGSYYNTISSLESDQSVVYKNDTISSNRVSYFVHVDFCFYH